MKKLALLGVSLLLLAALNLNGLICLQAHADSGTATTTMSLIVPVVTAVSCSSAQVSAPSGTQTNTLNVICTITGNPNGLAATGNAFSPSTVTMTNSASNTLTATLQSGVTSPNTSITGITGTASGFSGTLATGTGNTWKVQVSYTVPTTSTTPSGTYTSTNVSYAWSTI